MTTSLTDPFTLANCNHMRTKLTLILAMLSVACLGQAPNSPDPVILPEDVVQDTIQLIQLSAPTNICIVRWTYTKTGAKKALAAWEADGAHYGMTPEWKKAWLKHRTDKKFFQTKAAAEEFVGKLKKK